jgi:group II intron reverse transcriptase/maturase
MWQENHMPKKRKVHSLTGRITDQLMLQAFKAVKRNRGAAGVDKVSIRMFEANLGQNLAALKKELKTRGTFHALPLRRKHIPKEPGKTRPLGIPAVRDRVAQEVIRRLLNPVFEPMFHDESYGFREGRNCHQAIEALNEFHAQGYRWVLDADIKGFFDNIPHKVIMGLVADEVADGNILGIVERFLKSGVMEDGAYKPTTIGTPQGGVVSPLLANIVLNRLDWALHDAGYRFVRYADDFVVVTQTKQQAEEALALVKSVLQTLQLSLSEEKTKIRTHGKGYDFLGFTNSSRSCRMRGKSIKKFKDKVRELTQRRFNLDAKGVEKLNRVIRGTANYFGARFSTNRWLFQKLDSWIRMRLRCMKFKSKSRHHNYKLRVRWFKEDLGLVTMEDLLLSRSV